MGSGGYVDVLTTAHVTVRARPGAIEVRERAGSRDDATIVAVLVFAIGGAVGLVTAPVSVATWVLGPFVVLFGVFGVWSLVRRWTSPAVHLDCVAWTAAGPGIPRRRSFGRPPVVHTAVARDRYGSANVALTAQGRSTVVVGRIPDDEAEEVARCLRRLVRERDLRT
ncbi:hypothetical protein EV188_11091 [Actinomycetospora succinea]|uniref:Uncharacterized protein n=1 Tax=Actinomycetospora succinea TaxID=663603 RepID=A0A4R6UX13_9PSEU|nr:hypothetical protein [Actinomycetospora succinea]TDQ50095.1 hypothetical protein EV188_11091 [Actinomycetospora succinea]